MERLKPLITDLNALMPKVHYEIERRVLGLSLKDRFPKEAELKGIYDISDSYFTMNPFLRVRNAQQTYPLQRPIQRLGQKRIIEDGVVEETEIPIDAESALKILSESLGKPMIVVEGHREEYSYNGLTVCDDYVNGLGKSTEIEKITNSKEENASALREVVQAFESLGVKERELSDEIYPVLLYNKQHKP